MLYDAAGKMNSITVSLAPLCLGLKLSKKFNQSFPNSIFILCLKAIFLFFWETIVQMASGGILYIFYLFRGLWAFTAPEFRAKIICGSRNSEWRKQKLYSKPFLKEQKITYQVISEVLLTFCIFYLEMLKINNNTWKLWCTFWIQLQCSRWYLRKHHQ